MRPHRIGVLFGSPTDRRLVTEFLAEEGYEWWAPTEDRQAEEQLDDALERLSLVLVEERVAVHLGPRLVEARSSRETFLPLVVALEPRSRSARWLSAGFDDVVRLPMPQPELRARLKVLLRHQEQSAASLARANERLRRKNRDLVEARRAAEAANQAKTEFLANISHELRTPLHGILGSVAILKKDHGDPRQLELIESSGQSLLGLVEDLLDFAALEAGRLRLTTRAFCLRKQLDTALAPLVPKMEHKGVAFEVAVAPEVPAWLRSDPVRLAQIVTNLVGNAVKFTDDGFIRLSLGWMNQRLEIIVEDSGIGIPPEAREKIFQAFYQVDASNTRAYDGTGLGLAILSRVVRAMGGEISVDSIPGDGSRFRVVLPVEAAAEEAAEPEASPADEHPLSILVVEDNPINSWVMQRLLETWGHRAEVAASGPEALAALGKASFDVILMDVQMPGMSGLEATRVIRHAERKEGRAPVPIVALTARARQEDREMCLEAGMDDYLSKPPDHRELRELLSRLGQPSRA